MKHKKKNIYQKKFFNFRFNFYKENKTIDKDLLFVDRQRLDATIQNSILTLSICEKKKFNAYILSDEDKNSLIIKTYKHLGFNKFLIGFNFKIFFSNFFLLFKSILLSLTCILNIYFRGFEWLIKSYKISNILIGDLIYDTNIRFFHRYQKPSIDKYFVKLLIKSTFRTLIIEKYFNNYNFKAVIVGTEPYSYNSGIALRIAVCKNIDNFTISGHETLFLCLNSYNKQIFNSGIFNIKNQNFKKFKSLKISDKNLDNFYKKRLSGKIKKLYTAGIHKKINISKKQKKYEIVFFNKLKKINKKKVLYASHTFSDAVHITGVNYIFKDFYEQLECTLKSLKDNQDYYWIFRPHPQSNYYLEEKIFKKTVESYKLKNAIYCPSYIEMKKLIKYSDYLVTGMGTAAVEFNAVSKKSIICGYAPYSGLGISCHAKSKKKYYQLIKNFDKIDKINKKKQQLAKKIIFFLENKLNFKKSIDFNKLNDVEGKKFFKNAINSNNETLFKLGLNYLPGFKFKQIYRKLYKII